MSVATALSLIPPIAPISSAFPVSSVGTLIPLTWRPLSLSVATRLIPIGLLSVSIASVVAISSFLVVVPAIAVIVRVAPAVAVVLVSATALVVPASRPLSVASVPIPALAFVSVAAVDLIRISLLAVMIARLEVSVVRRSVVVAPPITARGKLLGSNVAMCLFLRVHLLVSSTLLAHVICLFFPLAQLVLETGLTAADLSQLLFDEQLLESHVDLFIAEQVPCIRLEVIVEVT